MTSENFERCLATTLKWEGGYSNHPDDPGGPTMKGVIQREYDAWRKKQGKSRRPVRGIEEGELRAIYRTEYWDAMGCDELKPGLDLCVFDAAVNSGVGRARQWAAKSQDIDGFCDERLEFLQRLGKLWRVFGAGWRRRVNGIRVEARSMAGRSEAPEPDDGALHAGMKGTAVRDLQEKLRALGYPSGAVDGVFGEQTYRAVILFQHDHDLDGDPGVWQQHYQDVLKNSEPMIPKRKEVTHGDLETAGDPPVHHMNFLQRIFAWLFGSSVVAQAFEGDSVLDSINGARSILEPLRSIMDWASGNIWLLVAIGCLGVIALIRLLRAEHVAAYQNFDYQGSPAGPVSASKMETV
jgi:lysozyme family protein